MTPIFVMACDHRASMRRALFGDDRLTPDLLRRTGEVKQMVYEALVRAIADGVPRERTGLLMDTDTGADALARARAASIATALPVERGGGQPVFEFGRPDWRAHLAAHRPDYAKALVTYDPRADNAVVRERLRELSGAGWPLLLELLVPVPDADRPAATATAIGEIQAAGVRPAIWKLEGYDRADDFARIADRCRAVDDRARCIVLGQGADPERVRRWLRLAAGFDGFAVGRSTWMAPLADFVADRAGRDDAVRRIAANYRSFVAAFTGPD